MEQLTHQIFGDRYQVQSLLGRQVGRQTFLATDLAQQEIVVLKLLLFGPDFTWENLKLFEREANTLKALNHPAIPKYLDSFDVETGIGRGFALIQSYIDAPSLEAVIQDSRKFSEADVTAIATQLLKILSYLHAQNPPVIHRDIKPSNLLISNTYGHSVGDLYLVDFGSVQTVAHQNSGTITIVGSYGYIPLEQFAGQTTTASDLYSLGMTLIYLITGVHPADLPQTNGRIEFRHDQISQRFSRWLERMIHPHLDRRFDSAQTALAALQSEDGSYGYYLNLKPTISDIELHRDRDRLEIVIPKSSDDPAGFGCFLLMGMLLFLFAAKFFITLFFLLLASLCFFASRRKNRKLKEVIKIDRNDKISQFLCLGFKQWNFQSSAFEDIQHLIYNPGYTFDRYVDANGKTIRRGEVKVAPKLSIYASDIEYKVGDKLSLTQPELWWLAQELSDFLDLEIKVIYPTPKVPPEQTCGGGC
ncbi:MAG: serine/threonine protein kinase [Thainema sp.]